MVVLRMKCREMRLRRELHYKILVNCARRDQSRETDVLPSAHTVAFKN